MNTTTNITREVYSTTFEGLCELARLADAISLTASHARPDNANKSFAIIDAIAARIADYANKLASELELGEVFDEAAA